MPDPDNAADGGSTTASRPPRRGARRAVKRRRRWPWVVVALVVVAGLGVSAWLGWRVLTVKNELESAQAAVATVQSGGDTSAAIRTIATHSQAAVAATDDPVWGLFEHVYFVGDNLRAVRLASETLEALTAQLAVPALDAMSSSDSSPVLARLVPVLQAATPRVVELSASIAEVQQSPSLVGPVRSGVDQVAEVLDAATPVLQVVPRMLGAEGAKNYLLVAMNSAEVSGLGGSAASQTLMRADNGKLTIAKQASSTDYAADQKLNVDVGLSKDMIEILGDVMFRRVNATVSRPDFPTAATLLDEFWQRDIKKQQIDGVIALDPLALSHILQATGPIALASGETVTSENVVKKVLSDVYARADDPDHGDTFFKEVALAVFAKVSTGDFDLKAMLSAVQAGIDGGSLLFWSADPEIQSLIEPMRVSGVLPTDNTDQTTLGVFFRDASSGSKIDYYMKSAVKAAATCSADGRTDFSATVKLHLDLSQAAADKLPAYVKSGAWGSEKFLTDVFVYGPPGTTAGEVTLDKGATGRKPREDLGRPVVKVSILLKPGETRSITVDFTGTDAAYGPLAVRTTPMVSPTVVTIDDQRCVAR